MRKKTLHLFALWMLTSIAIQVNAQLINLNPDPNGEPWWAGGLPEITPEIQAELDAIPKLVLNNKSLKSSLPVMVDNSEQNWFRPIFAQDGGSCGQASGIGYLFTYEINRIRNLSAHLPQNQYPTHFTWNYLNKGTGEGAYYYKGWDIIKDFGIPNREIYGCLYEDLWMPLPENNRRTVWMNDYEKYYSSLSNRVAMEYYSINVTNPQGLSKLKHWLNDHGEGAETGGLANFAVIMPHPENGYGILPQESDEPGKSFILQFGYDGYHAMTIVGYNDNIKYDFNGDGQFTNPEDNIAEWEIGALKVANSHGTGYQNFGYVYVPYRLLGPNTISRVHVLKIKENNYTPRVTMQAKIQHPRRNKVEMITGLAATSEAVNPTHTKSYRAYRLNPYYTPHINSGGYLPMQGINDDPIEIELDVTDILVGFAPGKFFFKINEWSPDTIFNGKVFDVSLMDYDTDDGIPIQIHYTESSLPVTINNNSNTQLAIEYDYLPSIIDKKISVSNNTQINKNITIINGGRLIFENQKNLTITNNKTLTVEAGGKLESNDINIDAGSTLIVNNCGTLKMNDNSVLTAQNGSTLSIYPDAILDVPGHSAFNISSQANIPGDCVNPFHVVPPSYKITESNQIWSEVDYRMDRNLEIRPGANLLLEDVNLRFLNNRKIVVHPNGILNIEGGVLTNHYFACHANDFWQGIEIKGNSGLPQTFQNQGALIISNGAIIKNAVIGVQVGSQHSGIIDDQGGIVQVNNAQFLNNQRDIEFNSYQNTNSQGQPIDNISYFHHCHFTTNDRTSLSTLHENVKLTGVQGISFNQSSFADSRTNIIDIYRRTGIMGITSTFIVNNSVFDQLHYGIYATSSNPNRFFKVYNSDFSTYRGIYFNGMDNVTIQNNSFFVIPFTQIRCSDSYGAYLEQSTGYRIENNAFESSPEINCNRQVGIINHNTGSFYNELYRNNFSGLTIGIEAIGSNRGFKPEEGLEIKCNQFENNYYDIFVTPLGLPTGRLEGIRELQGYNENSNHLTTSPAGNLFGNNSPVLISNFINEAERLFYFHHVADEETRLIPNHYSQNIFLQETGHKFDYENSCPDRAMQPKIFNLLIAQKQDAQTHYEETSVLLQAHVDDGNTQLMTQQVEMAGEGDAYNTYQYLIQTSPYLSEEVLTSLGAKEEGFNNAMIRDVMVENPQAAKSEEVNLALDSRIDQLPAYMRWQINNGLFQFSEKEIMEHFMAYQKTRHDQALNQIIMGIIHEQEGFENAPSLDQLLAQVDDVRYQYLQAELKFAEEDYAAGLQQLNHITQQYDLSDENALMAHQEMTDFYNLLAQWSNHEDHPGFTNLPGEVLLQLESYLEATPRVAGKALSLLMLNDAIAYEEPILYPQEDMLPKTDPVSGPDEFIVPDMDSELSFSLYPNPSRDYLTLDWCIESPRLAESGKIEFRNATGVLIHTMATKIHCNQQILPLDGWKSGTYTATLTLNNQLRKTITFVVAK